MGHGGKGGGRGGRGRQAPGAPRGGRAGGSGCAGDPGAEGAGWASGPRADASPQALQQYAACQSHAFMKGIGTFLTGSGAAFAMQKLARQKLPYSPQWSLLLAAGLKSVGGSRCCPYRDAAGTPRSTSAAPAAGSLGSYVVTRAESRKCSNFWIYLETGKSPQELAVTDGVSQPAENLPSAEGDDAATLVRKNRYGDVVE
ncbi:hypothetical protein Nmel_016860 [Mimus melanotis]